MVILGLLPSTDSSFSFSTPSSSFASGATSPTSASASASASHFGGSSPFGSSSQRTDPICLLFRSSSATAPTSSSFGSGFGPGPSSASSNLFGSRSSASPNIFGSPSGGSPTSSPFGGWPPSLFGTSSHFGSSSSGISYLFGSGAPTPSVFGVTSAASASSTSSFLFGSASSGSSPISSSSSTVSATLLTSTSASPSASSEPQAQSAAACVEACSNEGALKHEAAFVAKNQSSKVVCQPSENFPEVLVKNELCHPAHGGFLSADAQMNSSLQNTLSPGKAHIIEQILLKYGDITKGSVLRSMEAKAYFLQLVTEVVERLQSHTLGTVRAHDFVIMQKWIDDAVSVGFNVEWLQQRIKKVTAICQFQDKLTCLNEISEKVDAARITLWEMELQQMIVKNEIDEIKDDMDMEVFSRSNLCEGLL